VNWVIAPHSVTRNASVPTIGRSCGLLARRSCMSLGNSSVNELNTRPDTTAMSSKTITARLTSAEGISGKVRVVPCAS
jgi:hypothetical protein